MMMQSEEEGCRVASEEKRGVHREEGWVAPPTRQVAPAPAVVLAKKRLRLGRNDCALMGKRGGKVACVFCCGSAKSKKECIALSAPPSPTDVCALQPLLVSLVVFVCI